MNLRADPDHLPRLLGGGPMVVVAEGVMDPSPMAAPALGVWVAAVRGGATLLHPAGTRAPAPRGTVPVQAPPPGTLALVAPERLRVAALARWWAEASGGPAPPFILAATGLAALPDLVALLAGALAEARSGGAAPSPPAARPETAPLAPPPEPVDSAPPRPLDAGPPPLPAAPDAVAPADTAPPAPPLPEEPAPPTPVAPTTLPDAAWAAGRVLEGQADPVALGDEVPRVLLRARAGGRAILLLPEVEGGDGDGLRVVLSGGTGAGAAVAAWLRPAGTAPADAAALDRPVPGSAWTGWRDLPEGEVELLLPLPPGTAGGAGVAVGLRAGADDAAVEIGEERPARAAAPPAAVPVPPPPAAPERALPVVAPPEPPPASTPAVAPPEPAPAPEPTPAALPPGLEAFLRPAPAPAYQTPTIASPPAPVAAPVPTRTAPTNMPPPRTRARYETVRLTQHLAGESYSHMDLTVASLAAGPTRWAAVRVKLALKDGEPRLEFRQAGGWPHVFRDWLGRASDKFGPFLRIALPELRDLLASITDERDAAMMQALLSILPRATEDACRLAGLSVAETTDWVEKARLLADEGVRAGD